MFQKYVFLADFNFMVDYGGLEIEPICIFYLVIQANLRLVVSSYQRKRGMSTSTIEELNIEGVQLVWVDTLMVLDDTVLVLVVGDWWRIGVGSSWF